MGLFSILKHNKEVTPLLIIVGTGIVGSVSFGVYTLAYNPDVIVRRTPDSWDQYNRIKQDQNVKLFNYHKDFYNSRKDMPSPHHAFLNSEELSGMTQKDYSKLVAMAKNRYYKTEQDAQ